MQIIEPDCLLGLLELGFGLISNIKRKRILLFIFNRPHYYVNYFMFK